MGLRVLVPSEPIVTPADIAGDHDPADPGVASVIAAVTQAIDGPMGWLGRALGEQTIELTGRSFRDLDCDWLGIRLPCPPIIEIETVTYLDATGAEQVVDGDAYYETDGRLWVSPGASWPSAGAYANAVRIRYRAGYDGTSPDEGGTGDVPENARQAIIVSVQHLISVGTDNLFLSAESVDGIGQRQYVVSEQAARLIDTTCERLLGPLKVYA